MIEVFEGRLGGGKTLYAVERMVKYLASGGYVYTNIQLNLEAVEKYLHKKFSWKFDPEQYTFLDDTQVSLFHRYSAGGTPDMPSLVVIDEAHIWLNARKWASASEELLTFLTQSRKTFTDIIFISQSYLNIDKQIARLVQYIWRFRDMEKFKIPGLGIKWPIRQFLRVQFDYDGKTVLQREFVVKDKAIYKLYSSFDLLRTFPRLDKQQKVIHGKVKKKAA